MSTHQIKQKVKVGAMNPHPRYSVFIDLFLQRHRVVVFIFLFTSFLTTGCAHYPINASLKQVDPETGYRFKNRGGPGNSDSLLIFLAFSGGGTRAAALSYGVLEELAGTEIVWEGNRKRLLDEVDLISAVSGGSFTAAYYGLFGDRIFKDFEEKFLKKNIQKKLIVRLFSPLNWIRLLSPNFNRSDMTAEYYDQHLFEGGTFRDMAARKGPSILINATDMTVGTWFSFSQDHFDWICSDISDYPVSRAVAASSAVPVVLSPITLRNYAGTCGYPTPQWITDALETREVSTRRYQQAVHATSYRDAQKRPFIHLLDGGLSDNLGLRTAMDRVILIGSPWRAMEEAGLRNIRKVAFIVVNAETAPDHYWDLQESPPATTQALASATSALINRYNFETVELLKYYIGTWAEELHKQKGDEADVSFYLVEVNFDALLDETERTFLKGLPTSLYLPSGTVDQLRKAARKILSRSKTFQRLLQDLEKN